MLYTSFRVFVMASAILGIFYMIALEEYTFIFFPIVIIIWAVFSFFDENDREYLRRNGIDPNEISWFFPEYSDYDAARSTNTPPRTYNDINKRGTYLTRTNNTYAQYERYMPQAYVSEDYKKLKDKCKRNFKITIGNDTEQL